MSKDGCISSSDLWDWSAGSRVRVRSGPMRGLDTPAGSCYWRRELQTDILARGLMGTHATDLLLLDGAGWERLGVWSGNVILSPTFIKTRSTSERLARIQQCRSNVLETISFDILSIRDCAVYTLCYTVQCTVIPAMVQRLRFSINVQCSLKFTQISVNVA